jgi:DNA polymerase III alpha subunit
MQVKQLDWANIKQLAIELAKRKAISDPYMDRLLFEIKEIEKQGAGAYWADKFNEHFKYDTNKNGLVLPWLLKMTPVDPMSSQHQITRSTDLPDIDVDCLPEARDKIKAYAAKKYGSEFTCSVGTWTTFKFKSALQDTVRALGQDLKEIMAITKALPDDVDDLKDGGYSTCVSCRARHNTIKCPSCGSPDTDGLTIGQVLEEYESIRDYYEDHKDVVEMAVRLLGKIRTMGKHAGGVIISNQKLLGNVPMGISKGLDGVGQWTSMWTEGRNTQLSKLGYVKWDFLGLKTLQYISDTCRLVGQTRGYKFNPSPWKDNDPELNCVGWYLDSSGQKHMVPMDDPAVFKMINELRVETVFQFETDVQRGVLANGVRDYYDLQVFNAMGHPGPIAFIPEYVERRDDIKKNWKRREHPDVASELERTHGIIIYQEQLQKMWQRFAGFTAPEAEAARKAVAKKWVDKLKPVKDKWLKGATKTLGQEWAEKLWERMVTFGRYAFNQCLAGGTILTDCVTGERRPIEDAVGMTLESSSGPDIVKTIHFNGYKSVYRVKFNNGISEDITAGHKYLTDDGFRTMADLVSSAKTHSIKSKYEPQLGSETRNSGINIESIEYLGVLPIYSPEMFGAQHNYSIGPGHPIAANSHSVAYILVAYWCAWLKAHFAPEWWASVMSTCHSDKIPKYMNTARREGVKFGAISANQLTSKFSVSKSLKVTPGLKSIKGIGSKAADKLEGDAEYTDIDHFVQVNGRDKRAMEPLIKLGAFRMYHPNSKGVWMWYQYKYCSGKDATTIKQSIRAILKDNLNYSDDKIKAERDRQMAEYKRLYPKRKRIPNKILKWVPKIDDSRQSIMDLFQDDFTLEERLAFEKQYLGYYWHSPLDLYKTTNLTIQRIKDSIGKRGKIECVVEKLIMGKTKKQQDMGKLRVTDGLSECTIMLWSTQLQVLKPYLKEGLGLRIDVKYDPSRNSFTLADRNTVPIPLELVE